MKTLIFVLSGDAETLVGDAFKNVLTSFEPGLGVTPMPPTEVPALAHKALDPVALTTLIFSIPSAVLAIIDIADRIEKRRRAQRLIDEAKRLRAESKVEVQIVVGTTPEALAELTPDALLDIAQKDL